MSVCAIFIFSTKTKEEILMSIIGNNLREKKKNNRQYLLYSSNAIIVPYECFGQINITMQ